MSPRSPSRSAAAPSLPHRSGRASVEALEDRTLFNLVAVVNNAQDSGYGSLRDAITNANEDSNHDTTIVFQIPGTGVQTIDLLSPLPQITGRVDIQGTTDSAGNPLIELDGADSFAMTGGPGAPGVVGLDFERNTPSLATPSIVSGLIINNFSGDGIDINGDAPTDVYGCRIGTDSTGKKARPNGGDGISVSAAFTQIGQANPGPAYQNVISANTGNGINVAAGATNTLILNCLIGTDVTGTRALGNAIDGIYGTAPNLTVGGRRPSQGNIISANAGEGLFIDNSGGLVLGNYIGTNAAGTAALGNQRDGVFCTGTSGPEIGEGSGGDDTAGANLISGNAGDGVDLFGCNDADIEYNLIGTDISGTKPIGNKLGLYIQGSYNNVGYVVISGNTSGGVVISGTSAASNNNLFQSCKIGADITGTAALANHGDGVQITDSNTNSLVSNTIAFNKTKSNDTGGFGVDILGNTSVKNYLDGNEIFSNARLGINLGDNNGQPLPNQATNPATGPNDLQNYPVLTKASYGNYMLTVAGTLHSAPNLSYDIEIFVSDAADPSGFGQGEFRYTSEQVTTDASGDATISLSFYNGSVAHGQVITATAREVTGTTYYGDTSEFSNAVPVHTNTVAGNIYDDANGNGKQDKGEKGLESHVVYADLNDDGLDDGSDPEAFTDSNGNYRLSGLPTGPVRIREENRQGWRDIGTTFYDLDIKADTKTSNIDFAQQAFSPNPAPTLLVTAGTNYDAENGEEFQGDVGTYSSGASLSQTPFAVAKTDDDPLFYDYTYGTQFTYSAAVPNGKYTLDLYFTEPSKTAAGQRVFNVAAEGKTVLKKLDIFAASGGRRRALIESVPVTVTGGELTLKFTGIVDQAIFSAIALIPA